MFVADEIAPELRRIVEFLNSQMAETEVLAVEVKQYVDAAGERQTIVPRVLGQTEAARQVKGRAPSREWDRDSVLRELEDRYDGQVAEVARRLYEWADQRDDLEIGFGRGGQYGSFLIGPRGRGRFVAVYTSGRLEIAFKSIAQQPPFNDAARLAELRQRFTAIPGVQLPDEIAGRWPSVPLVVLQPEQRFRDFVAVLDSVFAELNVERRRPSPTP